MLHVRLSPGSSSTAMTLVNGVIVVVVVVAVVVVIVVAVVVVVFSTVSSSSTSPQLNVPVKIYSQYKRNKHRGLNFQIIFFLL